MMLGVIAAASLITVSALSDSATTYSVATTDGVETGISMLGHLELVATNEDGAIKSYQQTDNAIVRIGTDCIVNELFNDGNGAGSTTCGGVSGEFDVIQIGEGTGIANPEQQGTISDAAEETGLAAPLADSDGVAITDSSGAGATGVVSVAFTNSGAAQETISEAIILNATSGNQVPLAFREFSGIPLDVNDQLTVTWTITVTEG